MTLDGRRIAVFRAAGGWYALDAACPHRGGPLADGIVCDRAVICPLHDRRYDLATGAPLGAGEPVAAYAVAGPRRPRLRRGRRARTGRGLRRPEPASHERGAVPRSSTSASAATSVTSPAAALTTKR